MKKTQKKLLERADKDTALFFCRRRRRAADLRNITGRRLIDWREREIYNCEEEEFDETDFFLSIR